MNKWQQVRSQSHVFWTGLAVRERRMLAGAGLILASLLTWLVLVQPALKKSTIGRSKPRSCVPRPKPCRCCCRASRRRVRRMKPRCAKPSTAPACKVITNCRRWLLVAGG